MLQVLLVVVAKKGCIAVSYTHLATPGYSRQTVNLTTTKPQTMPGVYGDFKIGTGVDVDSVVRARDTFADRQYWKENSNLNKSTTQQYTLSKIESVFQEPTDTGLQTVISQFYKSWQTLSTNAGEYSNRVVARDTGKQLVNSMNHIKTCLLYTSVRLLPFPMTAIFWIK